MAHRPRRSYDRRMTTPSTAPNDAPAGDLSAAPLVRSSHDRVLYGVCGGIAARLGVPTALVRIAFALLALTGVGVAAYVVLAIAVPPDDAPRPISAVRVALALAAGLVAMAVSLGVLREVGFGRFAPGRGGSLLVIVVLATLGAALVVGRGAPAAGTGAGAGAPTASLPRLRRIAPPVLLLLTLAIAVMASTGAWLATGGADGTLSVGVLLGVALVVVGMGVTLSAWRGRSFLLLPLGAALAAPLALAAFADVSLTVGSDNPGVIADATGASRTLVLGQGAGPVEVRSSAVAAGLRTLVVRKGIGRIDIRVDRSVPVRLEVAAAGGTVTIDDQVNNAYERLRTPGSHTVLLPAGGDGATQPLLLKVQLGFGSVLIEHGSSPVVTAATAAVQQARLLRAALVADIAARTHLLHVDQRELRHLTRAYTAGLRRLTTAGSPAVGRASLRLNAVFWASVDPLDPRLMAADGALAGIDRLQLLRFNLLRAAWRTHSVQRGLRHADDRLKALNRSIADAHTAKVVQ
jgi:phage shock protein PspC (stress-responsive transcriptional regulator)